MNNRLQQVIDYYKLKIYPFERKIGVSDGTIRNFLIGKSKLNTSTIVKISDNCPEISLDWLISGKGEMLQKNNEKPPENIQISNRQCRTVQNNFAKNSASEPPAEYGNYRLTIQSLQNTIEAQQHTIEAQQRTINTQQELIDLLKKQLSE